MEAAIVTALTMAELLLRRDLLLSGGIAYSLHQELTDHTNMNRPNECLKKPHRTEYEFVCRVPLLLETTDLPRRRLCILRPGPICRELMLLARRDGLHITRHDADP